MQMGKEKPRKVCGRIGAALGLRIRMAHCMAKKYDVHREVCYLALMLLGPFGEQLQWGCHYMLSLKTRTCWSHASLLGLQWYPFLTQLYDHFSVHPYICLVEKTNWNFSPAAQRWRVTVFWQGRENDGHQWCRTGGFFAFPDYPVTVRCMNIDLMGTQGCMQELGLGRAGTEGIHQPPQVILYRRVKKIGQFSGEDYCFRQVKKLLWWTACSKGLQSKAASQCTFGQVVCPGRDAKAFEWQKMWGSDPTRCKLFPCRKVPGDNVNFWSVFLNQKNQCLLILAQLQQNRQNKSFCVVWD